MFMLQAQRSCSYPFHCQYFRLCCESRMPGLWSSSHVMTVCIILAARLLLSPSFCPAVPHTESLCGGMRGGCTVQAVRCVCGQRRLCTSLRLSPEKGGFFLLVSPATLSLPWLVLCQLLMHLQDEYLAFCSISPVLEHIFWVHYIPR